ncbi:DNA alkylation repair protein [Ekhidna sp.]
MNNSSIIFEDVIKHVKEDIQRNVDEKTRLSGKHFFKEPIKYYGTKTAIVRKIAKKYYKVLSGTPKATLFDLCTELWKSGYLEEAFVACEWSYSIRKKFQEEDFEVFQHWVESYVNNWASCDTLCNHTIGSFLEMYPQYLEELKVWAQSPNRWMRRAATVSLIVPARKGKFLEKILMLADILLMDTDDLVQKGYGWMLKVASKHHQDEVFDFVMKNKAEMPRTALRYAIEKMPKDKRAVAMKK